MADPNPMTLTRLANDAASGSLTVPISTTYPLDQVADAFAAFGTGALGKIAVSID